MNRFIILALFLNVAMAQVPFVCDFVCTPEILDSCPVLDCGPNESPQHKPGTCDCCNVCLPNKGSDCKVDCSTDQCPQIKCATGYESYKPPCECCNECRKIESPSCNVNCSTVSCAYVECDSGYESYTPPCECCNKCRKIITSPGPEVCEEIDCNGEECKIVDCIAGYVPARSECGCCDKCVPEKNTCSKNEVYTECGSACPITCANLGKDQACTAQCVTGCFCQKGLVRNDQGECVDPNQCPKPPSKTCGKHEVYTKCGSACPLTCANLGKDQACTAQCVEGCFCQEGLVRNDYGQCVHPNQCAKHTCGKNEVYSECGSTCPQTCANLGNNEVCTSQCVKGCFCREGLIRNDEGVCVQPNQCPKHTCSKNEVYTECGSACPITCANLGKDQACTAQCVTGCFCQKGLVRNDQGECVDPNQCPKPFSAPSETCGKNEVYSECGSTCPKTCANLGKNQVCSFLCVKGCFCQEGLVRNDKGECVHPNQCPKRFSAPSETCGKNEVYYECGSACPLTCANLGKDQGCTEQCVKGCFCRDGLIRNDEGVCVHPNQCPKRKKIMIFLDI
nr:tenascin-like isoform X1 [Parasteatoda tepidariorum]